MKIRKTTLINALAKQYEHALKEIIKAHNKKVKYLDNAKTPDPTNTKANANAYLKISTFNNEILRHQGTITELQDLFIHCGKYNDLRAKYEELDINVVGGYNPYGLGCSVGNNKKEEEILEVEL
jgi:hypothetical protein